MRRKKVQPLPPEPISLPKPLYMVCFCNGWSASVVGGGSRILEYGACDGRELLCRANVPNAEWVKLLISDLRLMEVHGCMKRFSSDGMLLLSPRRSPDVWSILCPWSGTRDPSIPLVLPSERLRIALTRRKKVEKPDPDVKVRKPDKTARQLRKLKVAMFD